MKGNPRKFTVVGIGASAGGLEALTEFVRNLSPDINMAFVLVQHLEPKHRSLLGEILSRQTNLKVVQAENKINIGINRIYVIPPNTSITISNNRLIVKKREEKFNAKHLPINTFLVSLAHEKRENAIGIILSGTGSDGSEGISAIKANGGITFAQNEVTARYYPMPQNAINTGYVDFILSPRDIARKLYEISTKNRVSAQGTVAGIKPMENTLYLERIFDLLRNSFGTDFAFYKRATVMRRIARRINYHNLKNIKEYYYYIIKNPPEARILYKELLISVTTFFRDPSVFIPIREKLLPLIIKQKQKDEILKVWVPGCSTGEEVYSIAMTIHAFLDKSDIRIPVQVFGTDLNDEFINKARAGLYDKVSVAKVPKTYLNRYFVKSGEHYKINKNVRDLCIFARHDVIKDPPLSKIDIISFRNVMIYFEPVLQKKVISRLYYSLNYNGYIILGTSESLNSFQDMFNVVDNRNKIYIKIPLKKRVAIDFENRLPQDRAKETRAPVIAVEPVRNETQFERALENIFFSKTRQAGIVVNENLEIIQFRGDTSLYVKVAPGKANLNLLNIVNDGLKPDLYEAIQKSKKSGNPCRKENIVIKFLGKQHAVNLEVFPVKIEKQKYFLVIFDEKQGNPGQAASREGVNAKSGITPAGGLKKELFETKAFLHSIIQEKEKSQEELREAIEEMQSSNEELQSMNEEIESSKEELQSTNEELVTLNEEIQNRNNELTQLNNDLNNFINSASIPTIMISRDMKIRRVSPMIKNIMNVMPSDIGVPIGQFKLNVNIPDFESRVNRVIRNSKEVEFEVNDKQGRIYLTRINPYITGDNKTDGAIITFVDINDLKKIEKELSGARDFSEGIIKTMSEPILVLDGKLKVTFANKAFYRVFKVKKADTENKLVYEIGNKQWDIPELRKLLESIFRKKKQFLNYEVTHVFPGIGRKVMSLNAHRMIGSSEKPSMILLAINDVTAGKQAELLLKGDKAALEKIVIERTESLIKNYRELEHARRLSDLGTLSSTVAHELRNPLSSIRLANYNIKRKAGGGLEKHTATIDKKIEESNQIINNLLFYTRLQGPHFEKTNISEMLNEAGEHIKERFNLKSETLVNCYEDGFTGVEISADHIQMKEMINNVFNNAVDAISKRDNGRIEVNGKCTEGMVEIIVKDNGVGINKETKTKMYEPFFTTKSKGTGLGLSVVKQVVKLHGGTIDIKSEENIGTEVVIRLPVNQNAKENAVNKPENSK